MTERKRLILTCFATFLILTHAAMDFSFLTNSSPNHVKSMVGEHIAVCHSPSFPFCSPCGTVSKKQNYPMPFCGKYDRVDQLEELELPEISDSYSTQGFQHDLPHQHKESLNLQNNDNLESSPFGRLDCPFLEGRESENERGKPLQKYPQIISDLRGNVHTIWTHDHKQERFCQGQDVCDLCFTDHLKPPVVFRKPRLDVGGSPHPMPVLPARETEKEDNQESTDPVNDEEELEDEEYSVLNPKSPSRPSRIQYRINSSKDKGKHKRASSAPKLGGGNRGSRQKHGRSISSPGSAGVDSSSDADAYQKYAASVKQASRRTKHYQKLVNFYANVNKHIEESEKKKAQTLAEKYLPSAGQLEKFYSTMSFYMEMEMAADHGSTFVNEDFEDLRWSQDKDKGLKRKEQNINDLHSFFTKLDCGLSVDKKSEERLERLKLKVHSDKMLHISKKDKGVDQLQEIYEGITSGRSSPVMSPEKPYRRAASLPATPIKERKQFLQFSGEQDLKKDIQNTPSSLVELDKIGQNGKHPSAYTESELVPTTIALSNSRPQFHRLCSDPSWSNDFAKYRRAIHQEDLLLMPALLKENMGRLNQFSFGRAPVHEKQHSDPVTESKNEEEIIRSDGKIEFISPEDVEESYMYSDWNGKTSQANMKNPNKTEMNEGNSIKDISPNNDASEVQIGSSQLPEKQVVSSNGRRFPYQPSSFEQDASPLTSRNKPVNTAEVKPFQWSEDQLLSATDETMLQSTSPGGAALIQSPTSQESNGQRRRRDFNSRPQHFGISLLPAERDVVTTSPSPQPITSSINAEPDVEDTESAPSNMEQDVHEKQPVAQRNTETTPSVMIRSPSSEEDEWLKTYDKVKSSWEESISAYETRRLETDNGSSQAEGSVHSFGGVEGVQASNLSHWNMDDDLLTRSLPHNFKLNLGKGISRKDGKPFIGNGSWEVFTEPQEDELYKTAPTTPFTSDGTQPAQTEIKLPKPAPRKFIKRAYRKDRANELKEGDRLWEVYTEPQEDEICKTSSSKSKPSDRSQPLNADVSFSKENMQMETSMPERGNGVKTLEDSANSQGNQPTFANAVSINKTPGQDIFSLCEMQQEKESPSHQNAKGPPPPYDPNWSKKHLWKKSVRTNPDGNIVVDDGQSRKHKVPLMRQQGLLSNSPPPPYEQGLRRTQSLSAKGSLMGYPMRSAQSFSDVYIPPLAPNISIKADGRSHSGGKGRRLKQNLPMEEVPRMSRCIKNDNSSVPAQNTPSSSVKVASSEVQNGHIYRHLEDDPYLKHNEFNLTTQHSSSAERELQPDYPEKETTTIYNQWLVDGDPMAQRHDDVANDPYMLPNERSISQPSVCVSESKQLPVYYSEIESEAYDPYVDGPTVSGSPGQQENYVVDDDTGEAYYKYSRGPDPYDPYCNQVYQGS